ncbi:MAG TPA: hypothetical protein PLS49_06335 [Candidatus Woesebacteria bacterium]|nr:hypothetical protein [Candidatus Woesebacteria bacterium]
MLTIICGEDIPAARNNLVSLKDQYKNKGYAIAYVALNELPQVYKSSQGVVDLFGQQSVYFIDDISSKYKGRGKNEFKDTIVEISKNPNIHVVSWEEGKSAYDLSTIKKIASTFLEHKPAKTVFQLLDACYPGNLKEFLSSLELVTTSQDSMFVYTLLWRHMRKLILAQENIYDKTVLPWQKANISRQAQMWDKKKLLGFYEGLIRIDHGMKTSTSTFDLKESIEILACYYLR